MPQSLESFTERIFAINPTASMVYGSALNVGSRGAMTESGIGNSASEVIFKLRKQTATLKQLITGNASSADRLAAAKNIEGSLMTLQTIGQISSTTCDDLIDSLFDIIEA